jgi:hypothetical protein
LTDELPRRLSTKEAAFKVALWLLHQDDRTLQDWGGSKKNVETREAKMGAFSK